MHKLLVAETAMRRATPCFREETCRALSAAVAAINRVGLQCLGTLVDVRTAKIESN